MKELSKEELAWSEFHDAVACGDMDQLERWYGLRPTEQQWVDIREDMLFRPISAWKLFHAGWLAAHGKPVEPEPCSR